MTFPKTRRVAAVFVALSMVLGTEVRAASIGPDCKPSGVVATAKEAWDPKAFWTRQLKEIQNYVDGQKVAYRLTLLERTRDRANEAFDAQEMRTLGIRQDSDPQLEREIGKIERESAALDRELVQIAIAWGEKCTTHARQKLSELK
jgi:hypothetical protein